MNEIYLDKGLKPKDIIADPELVLPYAGELKVLVPDTRMTPAKRTLTRHQRTWIKNAYQNRAEAALPEQSVLPEHATAQGLEQILTNGGEPVQPPSVQQAGPAQAGL